MRQPKVHLFLIVSAIVVLFYSSSVSAFDRSDDSLSGRLYNHGGLKASGPSVPFVDVDTNSYEKKFWLGHKQVLSPPVRTVYAHLLVTDSFLYASFSPHFGSQGDWSVFRAYSLDSGLTWSEPFWLDSTGSGDAGDLSAVFLNDTIRTSYTRTRNDSIYLNELVYDKDYLEARRTADTTLISANSSTRTYHLPHLLARNDSIWLCYMTADGFDLANFLDFKLSADYGNTWTDLTRAGTLAGRPFSFFSTDTALSIVHPVDYGFDVALTQSYNAGLTWTDDIYLSSFDEFASQLPYATSNGLSDIHAGWFDFDGAPAGWYGYLFYRRSVDAGRTWEPIRSLSTAPCTYNSNFWADTNRVYAVWNDCRENGSPDFALYMRYSHDRGATWSPEMEIVDKIDPARRPILGGQGDLVYVLWEEQHPPDWTWEIAFMVGGWYYPGDVDLSETLDMSDLTFLVAHLFQGGRAPLLLGAAEMNGDSELNISDITYFIDYLFRDGPTPVG